MEALLYCNINGIIRRYIALHSFFIVKNIFKKDEKKKRIRFILKSFFPSYSI